MPRALLTRTFRVPTDQRDAAIARLRDRRQIARDADCNFWVFEDAAAEGVWLEFIEARDEALLRRASVAHGDASSHQIFLEVEL